NGDIDRWNTRGNLEGYLYVELDRTGVSEWRRQPANGDGCASQGQRGARWSERRCYAVREVRAVYADQLTARHVTGGDHKGRSIFDSRDRRRLRRRKRRHCQHGDTSNRNPLERRFSRHDRTLPALHVLLLSSFPAEP